MSASETIKKIRLSLCLEQAEFGELLGISRQTVWHYENSSRQPRLAKIRKIMDIARKHNIKVSVDDFLNEKSQ